MKRSYLWLLLILPLLFGLFRLRLDVEVLNLLPTSLPVVDGLRRYQENFAHGHHLIITLRAEEAVVAESSARDLALLLRSQPALVSRVVWQPPFLERPEEAAELLAFLWFNNPAFDSLPHRLTGPGLTNALDEARRRLATTFSPSELAWGGYDPFGLRDPPRRSPTTQMEDATRLFVSASGTFRVLFVEPAGDLSNYRACSAWLSSVKQLVSDARDQGRLDSSVRLGYTGRPAFVREIAGGMERDMVGSVTGTMLIIALLFYLWHRRWRPLLWLLALLLSTLAGTAALGGLLLGALNVVSLGFAAILLGLGADYALVLYQEAVEDPTASPKELRDRIGPGIIWSAVTTASAFAMLQVSRLPGLGQLGLLVAMGVGLAALLILRFFLPPLLPIPSNKEPSAPLSAVRFWSKPLAWSLTAALFCGGLLLLSRDRPRFDHTANALRPQNSDAYAAVEEIKRELDRAEEPLWVLVPGASEATVADRLLRIDEILQNAVTNGWISQFTVPLELWPAPSIQEANRRSALDLAGQLGSIEQAAQAGGFTPASLALTGRILKTWERVGDSPVFWPTNQSSRWVMESMASRVEGSLTALALVYPDETANRQKGLAQLSQHWPEDLTAAGVVLSGWELLGPEIFDLVAADLPKVLIPMSILLLSALSLAFRSPGEVLLSLLTLVISATALWIIMDLAGWSWNLMNMMALPLLLGAGVDYSIHIQLAMRRTNGETRKVQASTGWALLLCAATTFTAFASLGFSANAGLASLGKVCAAGIACAWVVAVVLLPAWWLTLKK